MSRRRRDLSLVAYAGFLLGFGLLVWLVFGVLPPPPFTVHGGHQLP